MANKEPKDWITVNGRHIPIYEGESKQDAYNKAVVKMNEDKKKADIERNKKESDKLNGKSTSSKPWLKWRVGDIVLYNAPKDFDTVGTPKPQNGKVASIDDDHAIVMVDGMKMWVDEDTIDQFKSNDGTKSKTDAKSSTKVTKVQKENKKQEIINTLIDKYKLKPGAKMIPLTKIKPELQQVMADSGIDWTESDYHFMLGSIVHGV